MIEFNDIQPCPMCEGDCNRENFGLQNLGRIQGVECAVTYLYCEWCEKGWEALWRKIDGIWRFDPPAVPYSREDAEGFLKFQQRLRENTVAA